MYFGVRWEDECVADLEEIYGDLETADSATGAVAWELARNPTAYTWQVSPSSDIRLTLVKPYRGFPPVAMSFRVVTEPPDRYCLVLRARRANAPETS
jgi:hypothetical protein